MYGAIIRHHDIIDIIGIHDDKEVVKKFIIQNIEKNPSLEFVKIKKKILKNEDITLYDSKYLVRLSDKYIPYELYETSKEISDEAIYDIKYCKDVLFRILEDSNLTEKEVKAISKTIHVLDDEIRNMELNVMDIKSLQEIQELNNNFRKEGLQNV